MASKKIGKDDLQEPKGMRDILPNDYTYFETVYKKAEEISSFYNFQMFQLPHVEKSVLFEHTVGETSDIVEKEMYSLKTKGSDGLVLRPEGTAPVMRSYLQHGMHTWSQPVMLSYKGSFFRYENPQKGRFREFQQFGIEIIGEESAIAEAIVIKTMTLILEELGVGPITIQINSRGDKDCINNYRKALIAYYKKYTKDLCKDCQRRFKTNPFRLLDCKDEKCIEIRDDAPQILDHLCNPCKKHFKEVLEHLDLNNIPYLLNPYLVRGLDYYSRTVFEIFADGSEKLSQSALGSGGRYDGLSKTLGKKEVPGVGGGLGVDRIVELMKEKKIKPKNDKKAKVFFIQLGSLAKYKSLNIVEMLRKANIPVAQSLTKNNLGGQLSTADKLGVSYALIMGQKEAQEDSVIIRDMKTRAQTTIKLNDIVATIKKKLK